MADRARAVTAAGGGASPRAPEPPGEPLLEVDDLTISLRTAKGIRRAVDGISLTIATGEIVGLAGESGSGKTLTALSLLGLLPGGARTSGSALFRGRDLLQLSRKQMRAIRGNELSYVSQDPMTALHPLLRIEVQLTEHVRAHLGLSAGEATARALELLEAVRIPDPEHALGSYPHQFSGGMRQRIAIAMALACEPALLVADEPTTALDVTVQAGILRLLDQLRRERGFSVMIITHDLGVLSSIAGRLYVLYGGRVAESGPTGAVLGSPRHPYTLGLMRSLPGAVAAGAPMRPISGSPPTLDRMPPGCHFHPRCEWALERCRVAVPPLRLLPGDRTLACEPDPLAPASQGAGSGGGGEDAGSWGAGGGDGSGGDGARHPTADPTVTA
ncbi:MAG TPA: ABC transporter ATP-binding protein [Acidimicrobiales bacterium]|nr:ABC transporter ATP-binding protein [Acidimicrobiales bacterium]